MMVAKQPISGLALVVVTVVVLLAASPALAATYYVSEFGHDFIGDGSQENPWATIAKADSSNLQPGDVVVVSGNFAWDEGEGDLQYSSGTPEAPITYISTDGAKITSQTGAAIKIFGSTVSNIVIDGFEITGGPIELAEGADNITIRNCYIHDIGVFAYHQYETLGGVYCKINMLSGGSSGCRIERNILGDMSETPKYDWTIGQVQTTDLKIYNNTIVNACVALCDASTVVGKPVCTGTVMKNNIIQKMWYSAIALYGSTNFIHSHNIYWDTNRKYDDGGVATPDATELNVDPLFVGGSPFDYHLTACSPAINAGTDVGLPGSVGVPDIGRYETSYTGVEARITGKVTKSSNGAPIQWATVELVGLGKSTTTDASGNYQFCALDPGSYTVRASMPGFSPSESEVQVAQSSTTTKDFVLTDLSKTYYVTPNGDNGTNGDGSLEHPWKQIDYGDVNSLLGPGDVVLVQPGTYTYENGNFSSASGVILANCSGALGNPITYKANGTGVKIVRTNQVAQSGIRVNSAALHDIVIDGFDISGAMPGIRIAAADRITVKNCYIHDANIPSAVNGIALAAVSGEQSEDCLFMNNVISNLQGSSLGGGVALYTGVRTKVYHNTIDRVGVGLWLIDQGAASIYQGVEFKNNISANCVWGIAIQIPTAAVWQYNCYWNNQINNGGGGVGEFVGDPMFVGGDPYDYHLQQGSAAIDKGIDLGYPYYGTAPDCGAFESLYGAEYGSLVDVKSLAPGTAVQVTEPKIVTAGSDTFADGSYYVEEPNRVCGLKVKPEVTGLPSVIPGDAITMIGVVRVDANGETYLGLHEITKSAGTPLQPIGASGVGAAYSRLAGSGILVRTWGLVTKVTSNYIYVDDGTGYDDGSGNGTGIRIVLSGLTNPITKTFVEGVTYVMGVTGLAGLDTGGVVCIRPRSDADIQL